MESFESANYPTMSAHSFYCVIFFKWCPWSALKGKTVLFHNFVANKTRPNFQYNLFVLFIYYLRSALQRLFVCSCGSGWYIPMGSNIPIIGHLLTSDIPTVNNEILRIKTTSTPNEQIWKNMRKFKYICVFFLPLQNYALVSNFCAQEIVRWCWYSKCVHLQNVQRITL